MSEVRFFIPAGGEGNRLRPLTNETPKPLLPVARTEDGKLLRIVDTPVAIAQALGKRTVVTGCYLAEQVTEHFSGRPEIQTAADKAIVHIGGSMRQHRDLLFQGDPDTVVMVPGDHYVPEEAIKRLIGKLRSSGADVALLGTWKVASHEQYPIAELSGSSGDVNLTYAPELTTEGRKHIGALGTYAFNAAWLRERLSRVPVDDSGHCDLTTDVVFGRDQPRPPHLVFEPLRPDEYWQDVGTVRRLFEHIRWLHPLSARDEHGNVNLSRSDGWHTVTDSVIYRDATTPPGRHAHSFIAKNFVQRYDS